MAVKKLSPPKLKVHQGPEAEKILLASVAEIVGELTGVRLGEKQSHMVASRFRKRLIDLRMRRPQEYVSYFNENTEAETQALVSLLTTHHTFFFREFTHFEFLRDQGLAALVAAAKKRGQSKLRFWSAACSRGHEVYSLALFLDFHLKKIDPTFTFEIVGTDVDPKSVSIAQNGVYHRKDIISIPALYMGDHWARGTGEIADYAKVKASIKSRCKFQTQNLLDISRTKSEAPFDAIFCRNVFIYFSPAQIKLITENLLQCLRPDGYFFVGVSESLGGVDLPMKNVGIAIYERSDSARLTKVSGVSAKPTPAPAAVSVAAKPKLTRVLAVDDSGTVHSLLRQILRPEYGFEIVGKALNGLEAAEFLKKNTVDVMTLDIHMPEQTGIEYLEKNFRRGHPPVVMISSVSRDNADLAVRALQLGASDYVEKPALNQLQEQGDQIRTKLSCAVINHGLEEKVVARVDQEFKAALQIKAPDTCFRIVMAGPGDRKKIDHLIREFTGDQPPTVFLMDGLEQALPAVAKDLSSLSGRSIELI